MAFDDNIQQRKAPAIIPEELVELCIYDPNWDYIFAQEAHSLASALGRENVVSIQHFGSTAIVGMMAKPVIDIIIGLRIYRLDDDDFNKLSRLNYQFIEQSPYCQRFYFQKRVKTKINLSITSFNSDMWKDCLGVRDYLRVHPTEKNEYINKKIDAIKTGHLTISHYSVYKLEFLKKLTHKARTWRSTI